ncbi:MAG: hypothetical protein ACX939_11535, partial [Hyphococcus sp.]
SDKHAAAAYIRRPVRHVPVISLRAAALFAQDMNADPHVMAEDYIPVTLGASRLFAVFINDSAVDLAFLPDTLVVVDYHDRSPGDGEFCLANVRQQPMIRRWRMRPARLEPVSREAGHETILATPEIVIIGSVRVSIRVH